MKVSVWDTYVPREDGRSMHFDILVPSELRDERAILGFGMDYLKRKSAEDLVLTTNECRFCHIAHATDELKAEIEKKGYAIIAMENCD